MVIVKLIFAAVLIIVLLFRIFRKNNKELKKDVFVYLMSVMILAVVFDIMDYNLASFFFAGVAVTLVIVGDKLKL